MSQRIDLVVDENMPAGGFGPDDLGRILLRGTAADPPGREVFLGIARQADVDGYLDGVARTELDDLDFYPFRPGYRQIPGTAQPAPPGDQTFWSASHPDPARRNFAGTSRTATGRSS